jgi:uncharacterized membrane protein YoaK (UPF0700 family)
MENKRDNVRFLTLVLTLTAGYCDCLTFVAADKIFSAHVTGNFIVFAYQIIIGTNGSAWNSLMTFPVFIISVMTGGWLIAKFSNVHLLFFCEGVVLLTGAILAYLLHSAISGETTASKYLVTMLVVFAMGLQNAVGRRYSKQTYGPTTMMTGNVTQFALDIGSFFNSGFRDRNLRLMIANELTTLGGFLTGCVLGAFSGHHFGLIGIALPGFAMIIIFFCTKSLSAIQPYFRYTSVKDDYKR